MTSPSIGSDIQILPPAVVPTGTLLTHSWQSYTLLWSSAACTETPVTGHACCQVSWSSKIVCTVAQHWEKIYRRLWKFLNGWQPLGHIDTTRKLYFRGNQYVGRTDEVYCVGISVASKNIVARGNMVVIELIWDILGTVHWYSMLINTVWGMKWTQFFGSIISSD